MKNLIILSILATIVFTQSSCVYKLGGHDIYSASASNEEGQKLVKEYDIHYLSPSTYRFYWTDFYRSKGYFVYDYHLKGDKNYYKTITPEIESQYQLTPDFSFWDKYGMYIVIIIIIVVVFYFSKSS